ncbi:MAG: hypothetical protein AAGI07_18855, partial [Bacteroidota bacterium]
MKIKVVISILFMLILIVFLLKQHEEQKLVQTFEKEKQKVLVETEKLKNRGDYINALRLTEIEQTQ